jgi:hypothetical protein
VLVLGHRGPSVVDRDDWNTEGEQNQGAKTCRPPLKCRRVEMHYVYQSDG